MPSQVWEEPPNRSIPTDGPSHQPIIPWRRRVHYIQRNTARNSQRAALSKILIVLLPERLGGERRGVPHLGRHPHGGAPLLQGRGRVRPLEERVDLEDPADGAPAPVLEPLAVRRLEEPV